MCALNRLDRYHLAQAAPRTVPRRLGTRGDHAEQALRDALAAHHAHVCRTGEDLPEIRNGVWAERHASTQLDPRRVEGDIMQGDGEIGDRHPGMGASGGSASGETVDGWTVVPEALR